MGVSVIVLACALLGVALLVGVWRRTADHPNRLLWRCVAATGALVLNAWWLAIFLWLVIRKPST